MQANTTPLSRRRALQLGLAASAGFALTPHGRAASESPLLTRPIPSTGELIPVVGLGTNRYGVESEEDYAPRREVLRNMPDLGLTVVDTAPGYGRSEIVIGELLEQIGNRDWLWLATKVTADGEDLKVGLAMLEESFKRLKTDHIELMQVHSLRGTATLLPVLREWKQQGRIKYYGVTTSNDAHYEELEQLLKQEPMDFLQIDYSAANRNSAERILPLAKDKGIATLINVPLGGTRNNLMGTFKEKPLPGLAKEIGATSWAQVFLKYVISHPAVTCAIPGTTRVEHLKDNALAARGALPDEAMRKDIEKMVDEAI